MLISFVNLTIESFSRTDLNLPIILVNINYINDISTTYQVKIIGLRYFKKFIFLNFTHKIQILLKRLMNKY